MHPPSKGDSGDECGMAGMSPPERQGPKLLTVKAHERRADVDKNDLVDPANVDLVVYEQPSYISGSI